MGQNKNSQYDAALIVKEVHDFYGQFIRTGDAKSLVPNYFSHFSVQYNVNNLPSIVEYYRGITSHITSVGCLADVSGSLNNKYLILRKVPDNTLFHLWFNVNGAGMDPSPINSTGIEISLNTNDSAQIVATAINITINTLFKQYFTCSKQSEVVQIKSVKLGQVFNSVDFNTGFLISNVTGTQELIEKVDVSYDSNNDPVYQGQTLKGMFYDLFSAKFVPLSSAAVSISGDVNALIKGTEDGTPSGTPHVAKIGADLNLRVVDEEANVYLSNIDANSSTSNTSLSSIDSKLPNQILGKLPVDTGLSQPLTDSQLRASNVNVSVSNQISGFATEVTLQSIQTTLSNPLQITQPIKTAGTIDGTLGGTQYLNVNNLRQQILASHDREQNITYADFGTKDQRIIQVDYNSATISPTSTARKTITYTLVSGRYRRDSINWEII